VKEENGSFGNTAHLLHFYIIKRLTFIIYAVISWRREPDF